MEISRGRRKAKSAKLPGGVRYEHTLQFYTTPPTDDISLQEFEDLAVERLKILKAVENVGVRHLRGTPDYESALKKEVKKYGINSSYALHTYKFGNSPENANQEEIHKDHISHFILRLAYCRSDELRRWFIAQEMDLFRFRFGREADDSIKRFLELNKLDYSPIPKEEKDDLLSELSTASYDATVTKVETSDFFKVPFTEVLDLVKSRKVFLSRGYAYVPRNELVSIVINEFRTNLSHALAITSRALPHLEEEDRLLPMLSSLSKRYLGEDYTNKKPTAGQITADMIDMLSKKSFPLCMQTLHQALRKEHHLRHGGRQQYGLFLKGIGMSLDEALKFWRQEFTRGAIDAEKFDKQYAYNIRHNYGKEGKRADYTPYSCMKIIMSNAPAQGDHHGCPFRHSDPNMLQQRLQALNISKEGVEKVMEDVKGHHYQLACCRFFEFTHNVKEADRGFALQHPNQFFEESQKVLNGTKGSSQGSQNKPSQNSQPSQKSQSSQPSSKVDDFDDGLSDAVMSQMTEEMEG